jgi:hypothetical protein
VDQSQTLSLLRQLTRSKRLRPHRTRGDKREDSSHNGKAYYRQVQGLPRLSRSTSELSLAHLDEAISARLKGDLETAASILERILVFGPNKRVQRELARVTNLIVAKEVSKETSSVAH